MKPSLPRHAQGFTLTEIAVVMVIVALLIGGMLMPLGAQQESKNRGSTDQSLKEIREALLGFAVINGRLPCPAIGTQYFDPNNPKTSCPDAPGCESFSGTAHSQTCTTNPGVLPWTTLGLQETDAWGHRYTYRVDSVFARGIDTNPTNNLPTPSTYGTGCSFTSSSDMPNKAAFALCTQGSITVTNISGALLSSSVPAIVISHGNNGLGAYLPTGQQIAGAVGSELANMGAGTTFISDVGIDDQVMWIPSSILMNRMLSAGKLP